VGGTLVGEGKDVILENSREAGDFVPLSQWSVGGRLCPPRRGTWEARQAQAGRRRRPHFPFQPPLFHLHSARRRPTPSWTTRSLVTTASPPVPGPIGHHMEASRLPADGNRARSHTAQLSTLLISRRAHCNKFGNDMLHELFPRRTAAAAVHPVHRPLQSPGPPTCLCRLLTLPPHHRPNH
jgi:hypothetical protein